MVDLKSDIPPPCNSCGGSLLPTEGWPSPLGLIRAKVHGSYSSLHLTDLTQYEFSLCELCLRHLFSLFQIPPTVQNMMATARDEPEETYADDYGWWVERMQSRDMCMCSDDPMVCEHPNESPSVCPCGLSCYCRSRTCRLKGV